MNERQARHVAPRFFSYLFPIIAVAALSVGFVAPAWANPCDTGSFDSCKAWIHSGQDTGAALAKDYDHLGRENVGLGEQDDQVNDLYDSTMEYDDAIKAFSQAIRLAPDNPGYYDDRGDANYKEGDYKQTIQDYSQAIRLKPDEADYYDMRGMAYDKVGQSDQAIRDYGQAIRLKPDEADYYEDRGLAFFDERRYYPAIRDFSTDLRLKPGDTDTYALRGTAYYKVGQYERTIRDYTRYLQRKPGDTNFLNLRGFAHLKMKDYRAAIADYDAVLQTDTGSDGPHAIALYGRGLARTRSGDAKAGAADIAAAKRIAPKVADAFRKWGVHS